MPIEDQAGSRDFRQILLLVKLADALYASYTLQASSATSASALT